MMGASRGDDAYKGSTLDVFTRLANKAGYQVIVPQVRCATGSALLHTILTRREVIGVPDRWCSMLCWRDEHDLAHLPRPAGFNSLCVTLDVCCFCVLYMQNIDRLCCGMMFDTRGAKRAAGLKVAESSTELMLASQMGKLPVGEEHTVQAVLRLLATYSSQMLKAAGLDGQRN
jgi:hypothetical protein